MNNPLPLGFDNIEFRAAEAFAVSRVCVTALRQDIIPNLQPRERRGAEHMILSIRQRRIFDQETLNELDALIDIVSRRILDGTTTSEQFVADDCHIDGGNVLKHRQRTDEADELSRALPVLLELQNCLHDVFDLMHAARALDELRQRI